MTDTPLVLRTYIEGLETHDVAKIAATGAKHLAFVLADRKLDKSQFLAMLRALYAAFPDWRYEHSPPELRQEFIATKWRQGGTHTGTFEDESRTRGDWWFGRPQSRTAADRIQVVLFRRISPSERCTQARSVLTLLGATGAGKGNAPSSVAQTQVRSRLSWFCVRAAMQRVDLVSPIRDRPQGAEVCQT